MRGEYAGDKPELRRIICTLIISHRVIVTYEKKTIQICEIYQFFIFCTGTISNFKKLALYDLGHLFQECICQISAFYNERFV